MQGHRVRVAACVHATYNTAHSAELRLNKPHIRFFEVLAPYYCTVRG